MHTCECVWQVLFRKVFLPILSGHTRVMRRMCLCRARVTAPIKFTIYDSLLETSGAKDCRILHVCRLRGAYLERSTWREYRGTLGQHATRNTQHATRNTQHAHRTAPTVDCWLLQATASLSAPQRAESRPPRFSRRSTCRRTTRASLDQAPQPSSPCLFRNG